MTRLEELIEELCPDGVEYLELNELIDYEQPQQYIVKSSNYKDEYSIPVLTAGQSFILGYTNEKQGIYQASKNDPVIIFDDFTTTFHWVDFTFKIKSSAIKLLKPKESQIAVLRYVFYTMENIIFLPTQHRRYWIETYSKIKVPVPPLEVQREIVRLLDNFTELTAELTAELTFRQKQYEFYCKEILGEIKQLEYIPIGNLGKWIGGSTPSMSKDEYWKSGEIPWVSSKDMKMATLNDTQDHITDKAIQETRLKRLPKNTVAIVARSGILKHTLPVAFIPFETTVNQDIKALMTNDSFLPRFAFFVLSAYSNEILNKAKKQGGTVDSLNMEAFYNYQVPVSYSKEEQERIIAILDHFDALCNDLSSGLPAEIEARRKQYEYYRDKLLTFKEKAA